MSFLKETMRPRLENMGFDCENINNPDPRGGQLLLGERLEGDSLP